MARPKNKQDLIEAANQGYQQLHSRIMPMTMEAQNELFQFDVTGKKESHWGRDKNIRDVLIHLYEWHQLLLQWIIANETGECTPFLPEPGN